MEYIPNGEDVFRVKLRRAGGMNDDFNKAWEKTTRPYRRGGVDMGQLAPSIQRKLSGKAYADTVVADWNTDDFGVPFSPEACAKQFEETPHFLDWCVTRANEAQAFREESRKTDAGN